MHNFKLAFRQYLKTRFTSNKKKGQLPPIEVFDVMIKAGPGAMRLQMFSLDDGKDVLLEPRLSGYLEHMNKD